LADVSFDQRRQYRTTRLRVAHDVWFRTRKGRVNNDHSLVSFTIGDHRERRDTCCPPQRKPAYADDERPARQIDPERLAPEWSIGGDIYERAALKKTSNPIETAKPDLRTSVVQPNDVTSVERQLPTPIVGGGVKSSRKSHWISESSKNEPRLWGTEVETEQHGATRKGPKMLFSSKDDIAAQIVNPLDAKQRFFRYKSAVIRQQRERDAPAFQSARSLLGSPCRGATVPPSTDKAVSNGKTCQDLLCHREWKPSEQRHQGPKSCRAVEHRNLYPPRIDDVARVHDSHSAAGSFDRTRCVKVPSVLRFPFSKSRVSSNVMPKRLSQAMMSSSSSTESSQ
jgi:hypothetical protein